MDKKVFNILTVGFLGLFITAGCAGAQNSIRLGEDPATADEIVAPAYPSPIILSVTPTRKIVPQATFAPTTLPTSNGGSGAVQPGDEQTIAPATTALAQPSPIAPPVTSTMGLVPPPNSTPTPIATLALEETVAMVCQEPPREFNLFEALDMWRLADLRFESEELVTFEGWTDRPEPLILPLTPEPTTEPGMAVNVSSRIFLTAGQLNLSNGVLSPRPLDVSALLANPCGEACPLEVLGQSPNGEWQLIQVNDWLRAQMGLWLVSAETTLRLVPYVPASPEWQWADDSSTLWLTYYFEEIGGETLVIRLNDKPNVHKSRNEEPLNPVNYRLDYSPADNTVFAVPVPEIWRENTGRVLRVVLNDGQETASGVWYIPGVASVAWNEVTRSIFAQTVTENGVTFQELPGGLSLTIPNETLATLLPSFTSAIDSLPNGLSAAGDWAISPLGMKLALLHNPVTIWVFDCVPAS